MKRRDHRSDPNLDPLVRQAIGYAEHAMRNLGRVPPTLLATTDEGVIAYFPESMGNERAKDNFANTSRMVAVAYSASAVVLILESWISVARPGKPFDPSIPPSQSPDREECVVIQAESTGATSGNFLLIQRDSKGAFTGFSSGDLPEFDEMKGRFTQIMPPSQPSEQN